MHSNTRDTLKKGGVGLGGVEKKKISATKRFLIKFYLAALVSLSKPPKNVISSSRIQCIYA